MAMRQREGSNAWLRGAHRVRDRARWGSRKGNPTIYLVGTTGHPNYGDELITLLWVNLYALRYPDAEIWLDSPRPGQSAVLLRSARTRVQCTDTLFHACWNAPSDNPADVVAFGRRVVEQPGLIPREATGMQVLESANIIHVLGGGYINAIWPRHLALLAAAAEMGRRNGARLAITGAGLIPCPSGSASIISQVLKEFHVVDVRDEESAALLRAHIDSVEFTSDDVFVGLQAVPRSLGWDDTLVLCLQNDHIKASRRDLLHYAASCITNWGLSDNPLLMVECLPPGDLFGWDVLKGQFPQLEIMPFEILWREGFPVGERMTWISSRYHPHLLASAYGAAGVAIAVGGEYYRTKHHSLSTLGTGWTIVDDLSESPMRPRAHTSSYSGELAQIRRRKEALATRVLDLAADH